MTMVEWNRCGRVRFCDDDGTLVPILQYILHTILTGQRWRWIRGSGVKVLIQPSFQTSIECWMGCPLSRSKQRFKAVAIHGGDTPTTTTTTTTSTTTSPSPSTSSDGSSSPSGSSSGSGDSGRGGYPEDDK